MEPTCTQSFSLNGLYLDGQPVTNYIFDVQNVQPYIRHRLEIPLAQPLAPGNKVTLQIAFTLILPTVANYSDETSLCSQIIGYTAKQINLVDWYPFIVPYENGWVLYDPMPWGEHLVYDASDVELNLKRILESLLQRVQPQTKMAIGPAIVCTACAPLPYLPAMNFSSPNRPREIPLSVPIISMDTPLVGKGF